MSVIFSRAPLRISLGGGGTDLPSYYREHGGFLVSGAIDKYVYMLTHTVFQRRYRMKYSEMEEVDEIAEIRHPILRETLLRHWRGNPLEIASVADVPAGTGHGFLGRIHRLPVEGPGARPAHLDHAGSAAEAACEIEIDVLGEPVGKQDPYVAAHGGICAYTFQPGRQRRCRTARARTERAAELRDQLLLFYTGEARSASKVLADQDERSRAGESEMIENLHHTKELGRRSCELLREGRLEAVCRTDARALAAQASSVPRHDQREHRSAIHARATQRRHRWQARRRRRRRLSARVRTAPRGHAAGDGCSRRL